MNEETNRREQNALREKSDKQEVELAANQSAQSEHTLAANDAATKIDAVAPTELTNTPTEHTTLHKKIILPNADKQNTASKLRQVLLQELL